VVYAVQENFFMFLKPFTGHPHGTPEADYIDTDKPSPGALRGHIVNYPYSYYRAVD